MKTVPRKGEGNVKQIEPARKRKTNGLCELD